MEGLIILIILFSIIQKIAEKVKEGRQGKEQQPVIRKSEPSHQEVARETQQNPVSYNPQDPFGSWEEIFFPKKPEPVTYKPQQILQEKKKERTASKPKEAPIAVERRVNDLQEVRPVTSARLSVDRESIKQGILWSEVLGPPKSKLHWSKYLKSSVRG